MLLVCLEGRKGPSPLVARQGWQGLLALTETHFTSPDLLQTSLCLLAGSLPTQRNPTWGVHGSQNHKSLVTACWCTEQMLWLLHFCSNLFGVSMCHETMTSGHLKAGDGKTKAKHTHPPLILRPNKSTLGQSSWKDTFPPFIFFSFISLQTCLFQHDLAGGVAAQAQLNLPWDNHFQWDWDPASKLPSTQTNWPHQDSSPARRRRIFPSLRPPHHLLRSSGMDYSSSPWIIILLLLTGELQRC